MTEKAFQKIKAGLEDTRDMLAASPVAPAPVAVKALEWSEPAKPCEECRYDHVKAQSGFGEYCIEWKSWKKYDAFCIYLNGELLEAEAELEDAVKYAQTDYERRVRACLVDAPVAAGWQAIESAPKDGTYFDIWVPAECGGYRVSDVRFGPAGTFKKNGVLIDIPVWPSHWMPLPAAPGEG